VASRSTALRVILEGDSTHLEKVLGRVDKLSESTFGRIAKYAAGAAAGYASIGAAKDAVQTTTELAHATHQLHANFGLATKSAGEWTAIMKSRGTDEQRLAMSFKQFSTQIHNARDATDSQSKALDALHAKDQARLDAAAKQGKSLTQLIGLRQQLASAEDAASKKSTSQLKAFQELGISQADLVKHGNDINFMLHAVADGMKNLPPGTDKAAIAAKLFGRTWQTIAPLIRDGSKALDEQLQTADKYGAVLGSKTLRQQEELIKSQRELKLASLGLKVAFGSAVTPALIHFDQLLTQVATDLHGPGSFDDKIKKVGQDVGPAIKSIRDEFDKDLPKIADAVGHEAPKVAGAFVNGFIHADGWGKLALGGFLISKFVGWKTIFAKAGTADAIAWGTSFAPKVEAEAAAAGTAGSFGMSAAWGAVIPKISPRFLAYGKVLGGALMAGITYEAVKNAPGIAQKIGHLLMPLQPGGSNRKFKQFQQVPGYTLDLSTGNLVPNPGSTGFNNPAVVKTGRSGPYGGLKMGRTDQGVDFGGAGSVGAVGSGKVVSTGLWNGWPGTGGLVYRLDSGQMVYVMEDFSPSVKAGQRIRAGQTIGFATGGPSGIETGWANTSGTAPLTQYNGRKDGTPMPGGIGFRKFLMGGQQVLGTRMGGDGGSGGSGLTVHLKWKSCELTWYDPALGGTNSGDGSADPYSLTASGEPYNPKALTCAAPHHYAFGTLIEFSYGGHTVVCKVNDRGGAISGEHFDLSRAAAAALGILGAGKVKAKYRVPGQSKSIRKAKTPYDALQNRLGYIDLEQQAGILTPQQAAQQERQAINQALPQLHGSDRLRALGTLRSLPKPPKTKVLTPAQKTWTNPNLNNLGTAFANKNPNANMGGHDLVQRDINNPWLQAMLGKIDDRVAAGDLTQAQGDAAKIVVLQNALPFLPDDQKEQVKGLIRQLGNDEIQSMLDDVDAQLAAGVFGDPNSAAAQTAANNAKSGILQGAISNPGQYGLSAGDVTGYQGQLNGINAAAQATTDNTAALQALTQAIKDQTEFAQSATATEGAAMARWVTEVISKQMGFGIRGRSLTPSYGAARRA
jgi:hypothetical protein